MLDFARDEGEGVTVVGVLAKTQTAPDTGAYVTLADAQSMLKDQLPPAIRDSIDTTALVTNITVYGKPGVAPCVGQ